MRLVYSFSNDQRTYLYGREIEPYKKAVHEMLYAATPNERRLKFKAVIREMEKLGFISNNMPKYMSDRADIQQGCCQTERIKAISTPRFLKDNQAEEAKQRIGSVSMSDCSTSRGSNR